MTDLPPTDLPPRGVDVTVAPAPDPRAVLAANAATAVLVRNGAGAVLR